MIQGSRSRHGNHFPYRGVRGFSPRSTRFNACLVVHAKRHEEIYNTVPINFLSEKCCPGREVPSLPMGYR